MLSQTCELMPRGRCGAIPPCVPLTYGAYRTCSVLCHLYLSAKKLFVPKSVCSRGRSSFLSITLGRGTPFTCLSFAAWCVFQSGVCLVYQACGRILTVERHAATLGLSIWVFITIKWCHQSGRASFLYVPLAFHVSWCFCSFCSILAPLLNTYVQCTFLISLLFLLLYFLLFSSWLLFGLQLGC